MLRFSGIFRLNFVTLMYDGSWLRAFGIELDVGLVSEVDSSDEKESVALLVAS